MQGDLFWVLSELGRGADWVRNIQATPRVRVKVRNGSGSGWRAGTAQIRALGVRRAPCRTAQGPQRLHRRRRSRPPRRSQRLQGRLHSRRAAWSSHRTRRRHRCSRGQGLPLQGLRKAIRNLTHLLVSQSRARALPVSIVEARAHTREPSTLARDDKPKRQCRWRRASACGLRDTPRRWPETKWMSPSEWLMPTTAATSMAYSPSSRPRTPSGAVQNRMSVTTRASLTSREPQRAAGGRARHHARYTCCREPKWRARCSGSHRRSCPGHTVP
jgi:hypothetical protein